MPYGVWVRGRRGAGDVRRRRETFLNGGLHEKINPNSTTVGRRQLREPTPALCSETVASPSAWRRHFPAANNGPKYILKWLCKNFDAKNLVWLFPQKERRRREPLRSWKPAVVAGAALAIETRTNELSWPTKGCCIPGKQQRRPQRKPPPELLLPPLSHQDVVVRQQHHLGQLRQRLHVLEVRAVR